jgi:hypothetical protein
MHQANLKMENGTRPGKDQENELFNTSMKILQTLYPGIESSKLIKNASLSVPASHDTPDMSPGGQLSKLSSRMVNLFDQDHKNNKPLRRGTTGMIPDLANLRIQNDEFEKKNKQIVRQELQNMIEI